jgi:hypothetical protein
MLVFVSYASDECDFVMLFRITISWMMGLDHGHGRDLMYGLQLVSLVNCLNSMCIFSNG